VISCTTDHTGWRGLEFGTMESKYRNGSVLSTVKIIKFPKNWQFLMARISQATGGHVKHHFWRIIFRRSMDNPARLDSMSGK
jgi:hypothetical protein